jgi:hypothetical protein
MVFNSPRVQELVKAVDTTRSSQIFVSFVSELVRAIDTFRSNVVFETAVTEAAAVQDESFSNPAFSALFEDTATGVDSPSSASLKGARVFVSLTISDEVTDLGSEVNVAVFENGTVSEISAIPASIFSGAVIESVVVTDSIRAKFFWDPVDDDQTAAWGNINNNQTASWTLITSTQNPNWTDINNA